MIYQSAQALRTALEHRPLVTSTESGISLDRLRRRMMFERIIARIQSAEPGRWVLKGGMALEVRLRDDARAVHAPVSKHDSVGRTAAHVVLVQPVGREGEHKQSWRSVVRLHSRQVASSSWT